VARMAGVVAAVVQSRMAVSAAIRMVAVTGAVTRAMEMEQAVMVVVVRAAVGAVVARLVMAMGAMEAGLREAGWTVA